MKDNWHTDGRKIQLCAEEAVQLVPCLLVVWLERLMTTQTTSPTVTGLTLTNCGVSPQHIPNNMMCERGYCFEAWVKGSDCTWSYKPRYR